MEIQKTINKAALVGAITGLMFGFGNAAYAQSLSFDFNANNIGISTFSDSDLNGAFTSDYTFSLAGVTPYILGAMVTPYNFSIQLPFNQTISSITDLNMQLKDSGNNVLGTGTTMSFNSLTPGDYVLTVSGTGSGPAGGLYQGAVFVKAIPEIPTWSMMVVGIGLVGFALQRRTRRDGNVAIGLMAA